MPKRKGSPKTGLKSALKEMAWRESYRPALRNRKDFSNLSELDKRKFVNMDTKLRRKKNRQDIKKAKGIKKKVMAVEKWWADRR